MHASCDLLFRPKDMTNVPAAGRGGAFFETAALMTTAAFLAEGALAMFVFCFFAALAFAASASYCAVSVALGCRLAATLALWLICWACICRRSITRTLGASVVIGCVACTLSSGRYAWNLQIKRLRYQAINTLAMAAKSFALVALRSLPPSV